MKNEIKEITEIITRLQGCGRKGISPTETIVVYNKDIATALYEAGYRKQSDTVKEFAQKAISRVFEGITQRFCDCYTDGLFRGYPDSELSRNFLRAFGECIDIAEKEINDLAEQYGKEEKE